MSDEETKQILRSIKSDLGYLRVYVGSLAFMALATVISAALWILVSFFLGPGPN